MEPGQNREENREQKRRRHEEQQQQQQWRRQGPEWLLRCLVEQLEEEAGSAEAADIDADGGYDGLLSPLVELGVRHLAAEYGWKGGWCGPQSAGRRALRWIDQLEVGEVPESGHVRRQWRCCLPPQEPGPEPVLDEMVRQLMGWVPLGQIVRVNLRNCEQITDDAVQAVAGHCPYLQSFILSGRSRVTDTALQAVARCCPHVEEWNLSGRFLEYATYVCPEITDGGVMRVASQRRRLKRVHLFGCQALTDKAVRTLAQCCPHLQKLNVGGCMQLTDQAIQALAQHCTEFQELNAGS